MTLILGMLVVRAGRRAQLNWHGDRGLSVLQLVLRELKRLSYQHFALSTLVVLPKHNSPPACASRDELACRVEFAKVLRFS